MSWHYRGISCGRFTRVAEEPDFARFQRPGYMARLRTD